MAQKRFRQSCRKRHATPSVLNIECDSDSDDDTGKPTISTWPRFILIRSKDKTRPATRIHPFLVGKVLEGAIGKAEAKRLRSGELLVQVGCQRHAEALLKVKRFGDIEVDVFAHPYMNTSRGVIRDETLSQMNDEELTNCLKDQGV